MGNDTHFCRSGKGREVEILIWYTYLMNSHSDVRRMDDGALQHEARALAVALAQALASSSFSEKEKAAWALVLPEMRLDQLSRFAVILDMSLTRAAKAELAGPLAAARAVAEKYAARQSQTNHDFMQNIVGMVENLRAAERAAV